MVLYSAMADASARGLLKGKIPAVTSTFHDSSFQRLLVFDHLTPECH